MKQIATVKLNQVAARYGEHVPVATTACCNACRTCVQTNLTAIALGGLAAIGATVKRRFGRQS